MGYILVSVVLLPTIFESLGDYATGRHDWIWFLLARLLRRTERSMSEYFIEGL